MSRTLRILLGAASLLAAAACTPAAPSTGGAITNIEPASAPIGAPVDVKVNGSGFTPLLKQDLGEAQPQVAQQVSVQVDGQSVDTKFVSDAQLQITLPPGLALGQHTISAVRGGSTLGGTAVYTAVYPITATGGTTSLNVGQSTSDSVQLINSSAADLPLQVTVAGDATVAATLQGQASVTVAAGSSATLTIAVVGNAAGTGKLKVTVTPQLAGVDLPAQEFDFDVTVNGASSSGSSGSTSTTASSSSSGSTTSSTSSTSTTSSTGSSSSSSTTSSTGGSSTSTTSSTGSSSSTTSSTSGSSTSTTSSTGSSSSTTTTSSTGSSSGSTGTSSSTGSTGTSSSSTTGTTTGGGCTLSTDCPTGEACDVTTHTCGNVCVGTDTYTDCHGGCCDAPSFKCSPGTDATACGDTGACVSCSPSNGGNSCIGGSVCGCSGAADCNVGEACDTGTNTCGTACGWGHSACNGSGFVCSGNQCVSSCPDGSQDGTETDVDCGGSSCPTCGNGKKCNGTADCSSGHCVDGVCCNTGCNGACQACTLAKTGSPDGSCASVIVGQPDPRGVCTDDGASSCGHTGKCAAGATCEFYGSSTACGADTCSNASFTSTGTCDGTGSCGGGSGACPGALVCQNTTQCWASCGSDDAIGDAKCLATDYCDGTACQTLIVSGSGTCTRDGDCASGSCGQATAGLCD